MSKRKIALIGVGVIVIGIILVKIFAPSKSKNGIETTAVTKQTITENVSSSGKIKANATVDLHFQALGNLAWVGVKEGDSVTQFQAIASLDKQELEKNLIKALRDYSKERNDFEQDKLDTYRYPAMTDTIKRILEKNQWDLEKAIIDVELETIALKWATLTTPISGIITHIDDPIAGVNVTAASTFTVVDPQTIVFTANVDEVDVGKVKLGQTATINLDAFPNKTFTGSVSKIAFAAEISAGGATVFPVEISFSDIKDLRIGLNGDVTIKTNEAVDTISVNNDAVKESSDAKYVIKKVGKQYEKVTVKTGLSGASETQVFDGVTPGDQVVIKGFENLPKNLQ